jgi:hypothetical protein
MTVERLGGRRVADLAPVPGRELRPGPRRDRRCPADLERVVQPRVRGEVVGEEGADALRERRQRLLQPRGRPECGLVAQQRERRRRRAAPVAHRREEVDAVTSHACLRSRAG